MEDGSYLVYLRAIPGYPNLTEAEIQLIVNDALRFTNKSHVFVGSITIDYESKTNCYTVYIKEGSDL